MVTFNNQVLEGRVVLSTVLGTRFITPFLSRQIKDLFDICKSEFEATGNRIEIDICNCKLNPDNYREFCSYCDFIHFVDSDNPIIDSMLIHNERVSTIRRLETTGKIVIEPIPLTFNPESMFKYVKDLDRSKVYRLCGFKELNGLSPDVSILIAMSIGYLYPEVSIDLSEQAINYFRLFHKFWMYTGLVKRDSYNLLWQGNVLKIDVVKVDENGDNIFYVPGVGEITEDTLNQNFSVIPYEFGNSTELSKDPELETVYDSIANELQKLLKKRKKKKLTSELTTIERG